MTRQPASLLVSIVVPVRADRAAAERLVRQLPPDPRMELIIVDGGGNCGLAAAVEGRTDATVLASVAGRGIQMNAGAAAAQGPWLLFLHADSLLPDRWLDVFSATVGDPEACDAVGGWFRFALDDASWQARVIEQGVRWRVRRLGLPYGDQGLFVSRRVFESIGGYREMPLMEDVEFVRRLQAAGPVIELPLTLATSARRWRRDGWVRRTARNLTILLLYLGGASPDRLARWYEPSS